MAAKKKPVEHETEPEEKSKYAYAQIHDKLGIHFKGEMLLFKGKKQKITLFNPKVGKLKNGTKVINVEGKWHSVNP
jgi:hypothetical protein